MGRPPEAFYREIRPRARTIRLGYLSRARAPGTLPCANLSRTRREGRAHVPNTRGRAALRGSLMSNVTVVGTGYVGLVQGVCLAELGHTVTCVDVDERKVKLLESGKSPIYEPGIEDLIVTNRDAGRLKFATPENGWESLLSEVVFVAVGTPMSENGAADLSYVRSAIDSIAKAATAPTTVVMKSTVPPGTGAVLQARYL
ncbi:MAG: UDP-glucose/GDP-mannose dehydrogenase family protein, partial [Actinobacteria bacterium]